MYSAYRSRLGGAFPTTEPRSVLLVLLACNKPEPKTQKQIEKETRLSQPTVAKLVAKMVECDLLKRSERDPQTGEKNVEVTLRGQGALMGSIKC
jgi:DNA-binding MarR family transcriptional regulator